MNSGLYSVTKYHSMSDGKHIVLSSTSAYTHALYMYAILQTLSVTSNLHIQVYPLYMYCNLPINRPWALEIHGQKTGVGVNT